MPNLMPVMHATANNNATSPNSSFSRTVIRVGIISENLAIVKTLQAHLSKIENIFSSHVDYASEDLLYSGEKYFNGLFLDLNMMNKSFSGATKLNASGANIIGVGTRQQAEECNLNKLLFHLLQLPVLQGELLSVINLLKYSWGEYRPHKDYVFVKSEYRIIKINLDDILFIAGMKDYVRIYLKNKSVPLTTLQNLKDFEKKLPSDNFIRVHKSYIISLHQVDCISKNEITIGNYSVPVGEAFRQDLNEFIRRYL